MSEEEQLVGTLIKIESHRQVEFIPNEYSRHVIDSEGLPVYAEPQPQLTIPKDIADEIDCVVNPIGQIVLKSGILSDFTVEAISWIYKNNKNGYIAIAYANPLTRDLVKVVADD